MTLEVKKYYEKPLIVLFCIKKRMDNGLKTKPVDIVNETGLTKKAVYNQIEALKKGKIVVVIRENLKNIKDIQLTPSSLKELHDQTLDFLLQESLRLKVQRVIKHHDSADLEDNLETNLDYLVRLMKTEVEECLVDFFRQEYNSVIPDGIIDRVLLRLTESLNKFLHKIKGIKSENLQKLVSNVV